MEFIEDQARGGLAHQTAVQGEAVASLLASTALTRLVAPVLAVPVVLTTALLALGNAAHATCQPNGIIDGANSAIVLGVAGCADASGNTATVVTGATVTSAGTGVTVSRRHARLGTDEPGNHHGEWQRTHWRRIIFPHELGNDDCRSQRRAAGRGLDRCQFGWRHHRGRLHRSLDQR